MDISLRGGFVVAEISFARREIAEMVRLEVALLGTGGGNDYHFFALSIFPANSHVAAVAVLNVIEKRGLTDGMKKAKDVFACLPFIWSHV